MNPLLSSIQSPAGLAPTDRPCIQDLFQAQAQRTPDAIAVSFQDQKLTYRELDQRANSLARHLQRYGAGREIPVALYMERSLDMVIAILGVLKSGSAYVPIDLAYPKERLQFMLEDAKAPILLTQASLRQAVPGTDAKVISLDENWKEIGAEDPTSPSVDITSENIAYIIYTSGSTGKPKGVLVTHHNVVRLLQQTTRWYQFRPDDVWPLFHSYAFDVSVWELWGCLFHGGRLLVVPYLVTRTPSEFYDLLASERVTVLNQTPSAFRQLIWAEETAAIKRELQLRYVICAGEALELQSLKPWFERHGDEKPRIVNMYGITETTVHSTFRVIRKTDLESGVGSVIGVPIPDLQIHLVDEELRPVPKGTPGEICVGGDGVARGYLNRPELTRKRFIPDPFSAKPGAVMYRSGDLAQVNAGGEMEYLGRMDHQVKIRGFRVELGEIESALNTHAAIRESVVVAQDSKAGDKRLVAYLVRASAAPTITELREHLAKSVPEYMIPAVFMFLPALPLTTNGKVDRRALPDPEHSRPALNTSYAPPQGAIEETIARIWSDVLEIDQVGRNDNLFELGGDSIRCISILARIEEKGWRFTLAEMFANPTVAALAKTADSSSKATGHTSTEPFQLIDAKDRAELPADIEDAYPISRLQLGMFYYNELDPVSAMYHDVFSYQVKARFEETSLRIAVENLARRHPLMRTSFHLAGYAQPLQMVHKQVPVPFTVEDIRTMEPAEQEARLLAWVETEKRRPFNRATPPLFRFHTQWRGESSFQFVISFHHSCLDGWSLAAIVAELFQDYSAMLGGRHSLITVPRVTYRDFIAQEQNAIASADSRRFWTEKLKEANPQQLPRWPKSMCTGGHEQKRGPEVILGEKILEGLKKLAQTAGVPLKSVLLAAHQRVMAALYGQTDVLSGLIMNGRPEQSDGDRLVGLFLNTVPLRQQLNGGSWMELVKETFSAEQELMPHRRVPLAEIQRLSGGRTLFETAFDFVHFHVLRGVQDLDNVQVSEGHYFEANNLATYTTFMLDVTSTKLEVHIDYDPNVICNDQAIEITDVYVQTLEAMAAEHAARYQSFCPLPQAVQHRVIRDWNATTVDYPRDQRIHELFEKRANEAPERIAVSFGAEKVSYGELNTRSTRFAERLRELGVGEGTLVGMCMDRSIEMMVTLLGILKVGGAYLPLDPNYPKERLAFMLQDSNAAIVVTDEASSNSVPETEALLIAVQDSSTTRHGIRPDHQKLAFAHASPLAYVIYTSGSTGRPKGVLVTHRSVVNLLLSATQTAGINSEENFLAVTTLSFDIAGLELFMPLVLGAQVTIAPREVAGDGTRLAALLSSSDATAMQGTPATWRLLLESGWTGNPQLKAFCGGENLQRSLVDALLPRVSRLWNFYGPTETTIWSTAWKVEPEGNILIGKPLANTQIYILDPHLKPVPTGTVGELHIGGEGVAAGYLNRPELTAEKFVPDPFSVKNKPMYRTGDLARYLPDGNIECLGRIDHQVKVRGFRIEPGEVEAALRQHQGIAEALVIARQDTLGQNRLIGYLISKNGPPSVQELRDFAKTRLPLHMVPAQFVFLKEFPLTPNGKIDLQRLPSPEEAQSQVVRNRVAPRTAEEKTLATIWEEVLETRALDINDNFFEVGGDSLSATRVFARINRTFGTELSLREILEHPTIRSLGELIVGNKSPDFSRMAPIPRQPRRVQVSA